MGTRVTLPEIQQGADYFLRLTNVWRCDGQPDQPINRAGSTALLQLRRNYQSPAVASFTEAAEISFIGASGIIDLRLPATTTAKILAGDYVFDLKLQRTVDGQLQTERLLEGTVRVSPEVSRAL